MLHPACSKIRSPFSSLTVSTPHYTAVLDALTPETYILVVAKGAIRTFECSLCLDKHESADPPRLMLILAEPAALELNIRLGRPHFAKLEAIGMGR